MGKLCPVECELRHGNLGEAGDGAFDLRVFSEEHFARYGVEDNVADGWFVFLSKGEAGKCGEQCNECGDAFHAGSDVLAFGDIHVFHGKGWGVLEFGREVAESEYFSVHFGDTGEGADGFGFGFLRMRDGERNGDEAGTPNPSA